MEDSEELTLQEALDEAIDVNGCSLEFVLDNLDVGMLKKYGTEAFAMKINIVEVPESPSEKLDLAIEIATKFLADARQSEIDRAVMLMQDKFNLNREQKSTIKKAVKEEKEIRNNRARLNGGEIEYDMDSNSGRGMIVRNFADIVIDAQKSKGKPLKYINGKLRVYKEGVYPPSDEQIQFIKKDIVRIGLTKGVNLTPSLVKSTLELVEIECPVLTEQCEPDKDHVLVLNNGLFDTKSWTFKAFNPDKVYFSKIPVDYDPDAPEPEIFLAFVKSCFKGFEGELLKMQELFGYALTKTYKYQFIFYLIGDGGNGKGSMVQIMTMVLGAGNVASFSIHQLSDGEHIDYNIAGLHGKHANICGDVGATTVKNTENLKKLSSNTDMITGRNPTERPFQFVNYAKLIFSMNRAPKTEASTTGDNRRIMDICFNNNFSEKKGEIKEIASKIKEAGELSGVLNWALEGLRRLEANGKFSDKRTIAQRKLDYEKKSNTMRYFVEDCIRGKEGAVVPDVLIFEAYNNFRKGVGGAELGVKELKSEFINECKESGIHNVIYTQRNIDRFEGNDIEQLEEIRKGKKLPLRPQCFTNVVIFCKPAQKELDEFEEEPVEVNNSDAEMYDSIMKEMEKDE